MREIPPDTVQRGLSRERLVGAALELIQDEGLEGLSMRALAERLSVKAASLYWHVRDRGELLELLAESILDSVARPRPAAGWRASALAIGAALRDRIREQRDAGRILLEAPDALRQSHTFADLRSRLTSAGLPAAEAGDVAMMAMTYVIAGGSAPVEIAPDARGGEPAELAIDSGSRGVVVRAGSPDMQTLFSVPHDRTAASPAVVRGERVIVRRLRGVGRGEIELNPRHPWRIQVQAPTWNTVLDAGGLDLRQVHIDSGAAKVEGFLPRPHGVGPIQISGGVVGVTLHRPRGTALVANLSPGVVRVKLDDFASRATVIDTHWESDGASASADRFELPISSGAVNLTLNSYELKTPVTASPAEAPRSGAYVTALDILLDGVEARIARP